MDILVINNAALLPYLALMGIAFIVAEFLLPTKGVLGILGAALFVVGTVSLTRSPDPDMRLSPLMCVMLNFIVLGGAAAIGYVTLRGYTRYKKDNFSLTDKIAKVVDWNATHQRVELDGAFWLAVEKNGLALTPGQHVRVIAQDNLTLIVEPVGDLS